MFDASAKIINYFSINAMCCFVLEAKRFYLDNKSLYQCCGFSKEILSLGERFLDY